MTQKSRVILTDCDGVLLRWEESFDKFMASKGMPCLPNMEAEYSLAIRYGIPPEVSVYPLLQEFVEGPAIERLDPYADSVKYVAKLAALGFRFIVISSISSSSLSRYYRMRNLQTVFGDVFDEVICIETGANKYETLKQWKDSGYFWIEDHMQQAVSGYECGLKPLLLNHAYNEKYQNDLFPRIVGDNPWEQVYNLVCEEYGVGNFD